MQKKIGILQILYVFIRAADAIELARILYPVVAIQGRFLQLLVLAIFRKDISRLLSDMQKFINLSNTTQWYLTFRDCIVQFVFHAGVGSTVYSIADAKVALYCKIYERILLVAVIIYLAEAAFLEYMTTRTIIHLDVGLFNDLYLKIFI